MCTVHEPWSKMSRLRRLAVCRRSFPRLVRVRDDKGPEDATSAEQARTLLGACTLQQPPA